MNNDLARLLNGLAIASERQQASARLAKEMGGEAFLVFLKDEETGTFAPAQGFEQRLPGGPSWRNLLKQVSQGCAFSGEVAFPDANTLIAAVARPLAEAILVFVGRDLCVVSRARAGQRS